MGAKKALGDCFQVAWRAVAFGDKSENLKLVHAWVRDTGGNAAGKHFWHAWVEDEHGMVIDKSNGNDFYGPKSIVYRIGHVVDKYPTLVRYTKKEAMVLALKKGHYGPWHKEADDYVTEEVIANNAGQGNIAGIGVGPKGEPGRSSSLMLRRKKVAGVECFSVDPEYFYRCRLGKRKYLRYEKYVGNDEIGEAIRQYARANPDEPVMVQNDLTGGIMYLRYGNGKKT
jgi:hypothetical protein